MKMRNYLILWVLLFGAGILQILFTGCNINDNPPTNENVTLYTHIETGVYSADVFNSYYDNTLPGTVKIFGDISIELKQTGYAVTTTNLTVDYTSIPGVRDTLPYFPIMARSESLYTHRGDSLCNTDNISSDVYKCSKLRVIGSDYFIMQVDPDVVPIVGADYLTFTRL